MMFPKKIVLIVLSVYIVAGNVNCYWTYQLLVWIIERKCELKLHEQGETILAQGFRQQWKRLARLCSDF